MIRLYAILFCLATSAATAEVTTSNTIASMEAGIICPPPTVGSTPAPGTLAGTTHIIAEEPPFVSNARQVPAVLGLGFGIKAQSVAAAGIAPVTVIVTHPPMGDTNATVQSFQTSISGQDPSLTFYQFDYTYELARGPWTMTAHYGADVLFSVDFEVVDPARTPELAGVCGYLELLS